MYKNTQATRNKNVIKTKKKSQYTNLLFFFSPFIPFVCLFNRILWSILTLFAKKFKQLVALNANTMPSQRHEYTQDVNERFEPGDRSEQPQQSQKTQQTVVIKVKEAKHITNQMHPKYDG